MANLTVTAAAAAGINLQGGAAAAALGDEFANTGKELLILDNTGGGDPCNVTLTSTIEIDGQAVADRTVTVAAGGIEAIGPLAIGVYNDGDGLVQVAYDQVVGVKVLVLQVAPA